MPKRIKMNKEYISKNTARIPLEERIRYSAVLSKRLGVVNGSILSVFLSILRASRNNEKGYCNMSDEELMKDSGISDKNTFGFSICTLVNLGYVGVIIRSEEIRKIIGYHPDYFRLELEARLLDKGNK